MTHQSQFNLIVSVKAIKVECDLVYPFHKCLYCRTKVRLNFIGKGINQRMGVHKITANKHATPDLWQFRNNHQCLSITCQTSVQLLLRPWIQSTYIHTYIKLLKTNLYDEHKPRFITLSRQ